MKLTKDDPRLTAYVLDELEPEEREKIERALALDENREARAMVDAIRRTAGRLEGALQAEARAAPGLTPEQKKRLDAAADKDERQAGATRRGRGWKLGLAIAAASACVVVLVLGGGVFLYQGASEKAVPDQVAAGRDGTRNLYQHRTLLPGGSTRGAETKEQPPRTYEHRNMKNFGGGAGAVVTGKMPAPTTARRHLDREQDGERGTGADPRFNTEGYDRIRENPYRAVRDNPVSTFSIDVDTASYANVRRFLTRGSWPPEDAVRIEELINYFDYDYRVPRGPHPFSVDVEVAGALWNPRHRLVRIGLQGYELPPDARPASNLVFLVDVSGSMQADNKLPLLKRSFALMVEALGADDRVAVVVYAGAAGLVLPSTSCDRRIEILRALDSLQAGGSTNGGAGIQLAYRVARQNFIPGGNNRVILASDGDFNVGVTSRGGLTRLIEQKAKEGVFLTVLGFGMGNYKDGTMEKLADRGNGNYAYIDTLEEARKVLVHQLTGTLFTIAKDVKIQVEFNPERVKAYRLIGYENRLLAREDFNDDTKDAGEIGAGHTVTALYEVVPAGQEIDLPGVDPLRYQQPSPRRVPAVHADELLTVKLRYKKPDEDKSKLLVEPVRDTGARFASASPDFQFASAVAVFGMLLRNSPHRGNASWAQVLEIAEANLGPDPHGLRRAFLHLANRAADLAGR